MSPSPYAPTTGRGMLELTSVSKLMTPDPVPLPHGSTVPGGGACPRGPRSLRRGGGR
jgi:hypothetical protein